MFTGFWVLFGMHDCLHVFCLGGRVRKSLLAGSLALREVIMLGVHGRPANNWPWLL